jgi:mannitol-1-phosphate 5-dehydrogenase
MDKKLVLFGAGKIGRSFIGQLFAQSGYEVVFVDINETLITELNEKREYKVVIKSSAPDEIIVIKNIRGVSANNHEEIVAELVSCDLAAVSVGQRGLTDVILHIARGVELRRKLGKRPLDIIIAENMRNADEYILAGLKDHLGGDFPFDEWFGLIETSIGKMVPIMPEEETVRDPLLVFAEPYNTLILDKKAFKNPVPVVKGLAPKENMKAWVDRKVFIHNFGHVAAAYAGYVFNPHQRYIYEALSIPVVRSFTLKAMQQSAAILMKKHPGEFTVEDLDDHIHDLLSRFENKALSDTIYRVGCDLKRKLSRNDRVQTPLFDGLEVGLPVDYVLMVLGFGLCFRASDEKGERSADDNEFIDYLKNNNFESVVTELLGIDIKSFLLQAL